MWVYPSASESTVIKDVPPPETDHSAPPALPEKVRSDAAEAAAPEEDAALRAATASEAPKPPLAHPAEHRHSHASRDCVLLAGAYLFGTLLAGVLQALCDARETDMLSYYLTCWRELFSVTAPSHLTTLFGAELVTVAGALTVLFLLGLSALGPVLIFLFTMVYGAGSGLLSAQLLNGLSLPTLALFVLVSGLPSAAAAGALCMFGASALEVSGKIHAFTFGRSGMTRGAGAQLLLGQYALIAVAFVPLCGAATALAYLAGQLTSLW